MNAPGLAVVIPAFDSAPTIERAVRSALDQPGVTGVHVVDDGSHDDTARLARDAGATVTRQVNAGPASARNRGLELVQTAPRVHALFLDADDELAPDSGNAILDALEVHPDATVVIGAHEQVTLSGVRLRSPDASWVAQGCLPHRGIALGTDHVFCTTGVTLARRAIDADVRFDPDLLFCEDRDLVFRAGAVGSVAVTARTIVRKHDDPARLTADPDKVRRWLDDVLRLVALHGGSDADPVTIEHLEATSRWIVKHAVRSLARRGESIPADDWRRIRAVFTERGWSLPSGVGRWRVVARMRRLASRQRTPA